MKQIKITVGDYTENVDGWKIYAGKQEVAVLREEQYRGIRFYYTRIIIGENRTELTSTDGIDDMLEKCRVEVQKIVDNILSE